MAEGGYPPPAPTDPHGHALVHTVPQIMDSQKRTVGVFKCGQSSRLSKERPEVTPIDGRSALDAARATDGSERRPWMAVSEDASLRAPDRKRAGKRSWAPLLTHIVNC